MNILVLVNLKINIHNNKMSNKRVLSEIQYITIFKEKMVEFLEELMEQITNEPFLYLMKVFINDKIPASWVIGRFMKDCLKYEKYLKERNDEVFIKSNFLYGNYVDQVGKEELSRFRIFWTDEERYLSKQAKQAIWEWVDLFLKLGKDYYNAYGAVEGWEFDLQEEIKNIKI